MSVYELTRNQLIELKQAILCDQSRPNWEEPSWGELADDDEIVSDAVVYSEFDGYEFTEEDFCQ